MEIGETSSGEVEKSVAWTWWQRALFRLAAVFWADFCLSRGVLWQITWVAPWFDKWVLRWPYAALNWPTDRLESWFANHVFHLSGQAATRHPTGSGDTALNYVSMLSLVVFAVLVAAAWTAIAEWGIWKRGWRREYRTLYAWLRLAVRFTLAGVLLSYGFSKVFDLQFSPPGSYTLNEKYGDSSPMALLWTFMGFSIPYTIFAGIAEVVPGILLLFRRTSTVGALSAAAVMLNVVLLNFCYDVPVKLYSVTYLVMALFLLLPDFVPMWRFFIRRRDAALHGVWLPRWERKPLRIAGYCLQVFVIGHLLFIGISSSYSQRAKRAAAATSATATKDDVDGQWIVDSSTGWPAGDEWKTAVIGARRFQGVDYISVVRGNGQPINYSEMMDAAHTIHFLKTQDSELHWSQGADGNVTLEGTWAGKPAKLVMHHGAGGYPLMTRGFHWVQEMPYNR